MFPNFHLIQLWPSCFALSDCV